MSMDRLVAEIRGFDGVLDFAPAPGSAAPAVAWGDHFFYYAPTGLVPPREQPYATIVTKNYPGDTDCDLDEPGRWRLNIHVGRAAVSALTEESRGDPVPRDHPVADVVIPHPVYRAQGWVAIVNPGPETYDLAVRLLRQAHADARRRAERRP